MSLAKIQGKLSKAEMKNIMAGSGITCGGHNMACSDARACCENQGLICSDSTLGHCKYK